MMAATDLELKKAFTEMQINKIETTKKMKMIEIQCDVLRTSRQKYILTERGTSDLDAEARVFQSVGRMFALTTVPNMRVDLKAKQERCDNLIGQLNEKKDFLLKNLKEQEDSLREMVQQKKEAADSK